MAEAEPVTVTESVSESVIEPVTEPTTESATEPDTEPLPEPVTDKLVTFDWDDTLFPKAKVMKVSEFTESDYDQLAVLSKHIYQLLCNYIDRYEAQNICIVTAAQKGWIEKSLSCVKKYGHFSDIYDLLFEENEIQILSANKVFTAKSDVYDWKLEAILSLLKARNNDPENSFTLMSIGDSFYEFEASKAVGNLFENVLVHRVKLIQNPSWKDMINEMQLLLNFCIVSDQLSLVKQPIDIDYGKERRKYKRKRKRKRKKEDIIESPRKRRKLNTGAAAATATHTCSVKEKVEHDNDDKDDSKEEKVNNTEKKQEVDAEKEEKEKEETAKITCK